MAVTSRLQRFKRQYGHYPARGEERECVLKEKYPENFARYYASKRQKETGDPIIAYQCSHCHSWHVGRVGRTK